MVLKEREVQCRHLSRWLISRIKESVTTPESPKRADAFKESAKKAGANVKEIFWTLGSYDMVAIIEAPDAETDRCGSH